MLGFELLSPTTALVLAQYVTCKNINNVDVDIVLRKDPITYNKEKTVSDLSEMASKSNSKTYNNVVGLHSPVNNLQYHFDYNLRTHRKKTCLYLKEITVDLHHSTTIYLAKEEQEFPCSSNVTHKHEIQHHRINLQTARDFKHEFYRETKKFADEYASIGPFPEDEIAKYKEQLLELLKEHLRPTTQKWRRELHKRQSKIDTKEEYARLASLCHQERLAAQLKRQQESKSISKTTEVKNKAVGKVAQQKKPIPVDVTPQIYEMDFIDDKSKFQITNMLKDKNIHIGYDFPYFFNPVFFHTPYLKLSINPSTGKTHIDSMKIDLNYQPEIYIPRDYDKNSCAYQASLKSAQKVDQEIQIMLPNQVHMYQKELHTYLPEKMRIFDNKAGEQQKQKWVQKVKEVIKHKLWKTELETHRSLIAETRKNAFLQYIGECLKEKKQDHLPTNCFGIPIKESLADKISRIVMSQPFKKHCSRMYPISNATEQSK